MSRVDVRFLKWPDRLHWHFAGERIADDHHGTWIGGRAGGTARRGNEAPKTMRHDWVKLIVPGAWWTAIWNASGDCYVDVITPPRWTGDVVSMIDLDLDVYRHPDGRVEVMDEDEFEEHRHTLGYPDQVVDMARATTARLVLAVEAGEEPFGTAGPARLADWRAEPA